MPIPRILLLVVLLVIRTTTYNFFMSICNLFINLLNAITFAHKYVICIEIIINCRFKNTIYWESLVTFFSPQPPHFPLQSLNSIRWKNMKAFSLGLFELFTIKLVTIFSAIATTYYLSIKFYDFNFPTSKIDLFHFCII